MPCLIYVFIFHGCFILLGLRYLFTTTLDLPYKVMPWFVHCYLWLSNSVVRIDAANLSGLNELKEELQLLSCSNGFLV